MTIHKKCYMCNRKFRCTNNYYYNHSYVRCKGCLNRVNLGVCHDISEEEYNNSDRYKNRYFQSYENCVKQTDDTIVHVRKERGTYKVKKKIKIIQAPKKCSVCLLNDQNTAFVPCGHLCCCHECATKCNKVCPICRRQSYFIQKIYIS